MSEPIVEHILEATFAGASFERARELMAAFLAGDVAGAQGPIRIPFAVLKIAGGDASALAETIEHARVDWRDTLLWAGFDAPEAHRAWAEGLL